MLQEGNVRDRDDGVGGGDHEGRRFSGPATPGVGPTVKDSQRPQSQGRADLVHTCRPDVRTKKNQHKQKRGDFKPLYVKGN